MSFKYGRLSPHSEETHPRVHLANYLYHDVRAGADKTLPHTIDWISRVPSWPMYLNDRIGDCTCAGVGHAIQALTAFATTEKTVTDNDVLKAYEAVSGYNPSTGANDNGAVMQDVLHYWFHTGLAGHKISAYASVNIRNLAEMRSALRWFGSVYIGINVPQSAEDQFSAGQPWAVDPGADNSIIGGHAVVIQEWDPQYARLITWGAVQRMTWDWFEKYGEEAWVVVTPDFIEANGLEASGVSMHQLVADFQTLGGSAYYS